MNIQKKIKVLAFMLVILTLARSFSLQADRGSDEKPEHFSLESSQNSEVKI